MEKINIKSMLILSKRVVIIKFTYDNLLFRNVMIETWIYKTNLKNKEFKTPKLMYKSQLGN